MTDFNLENVGGMTSGIQYAGKVKLTIQKNGLVVREIASHNSGAMPLFKFLALCLAGDYKTAEYLRPFKIKLYRVDVGSGQIFDPSTPKVDPANAATSFITLSEAPILSTNAKDKTAAITIHFVIPYTYIGKKGYNLLCLYPVSATANEEYSAFYYLLDDEGGLYTEVVETNSNYNLVVDWKLEVSGKEDWERKPIN